MKQLFFFLLMILLTTSSLSSVKTETLSGNHAGQGIPKSIAQVITADNAHQLTRVNTLGQGWLTGEVDWSADGQQIAVASSRGVWLYTPFRSGNLPKLFAHLGTNHIDLSLDGLHLATAGRDRVVQLWDLDSMRKIFSFDTFSDVVSDVQFSPDSSVLAVSSFNLDVHGLRQTSPIRLWNTETGTLALELVPQVGPIQTISFSPDGAFLVGGGSSGAEIWNLSTGDLVTIFSHEDIIPVSSLDFSSDGTWLAVGGITGMVYVWNVVSHELLATWDFQDLLRDIVFEPDGNFIAVSGLNGMIQFWNYLNGTQRVFRSADDYYQPGGNLLNIAFSPNGLFLALALSSVNDQDEIQIWNLATGRQEVSIMDFNYPITCIAFNTDGTMLASGHGALHLDEAVQQGVAQQATRLWEVSTGQILNRLENNFDLVYDLAFSPDGSLLATSQGWYEDLRWYSHGDEYLHPGVELWDINTGISIAFFQDRDQIGSIRNVSTLALGPSGHLLVFSGSANEYELELWDTQLQEQITKLQHPEVGKIVSVSFHPDGNLLAVASNAIVGEDIEVGHTGVGLFNLNSMEWITFQEINSTGLQSVRFSPDGSLIAVAEREGTIHLWDLASLSEALTLHFEGSVSAIDFSADGTVLAVGGYSHSDAGSLWLWNVQTGDLLTTLQENSIPIVDLAFSPDGTLLATANGDGSLGIWAVQEVD
jgi:WD40 repeat protein